MIWIKIILKKKSFFCQTKGFLHGEKILVLYNINVKNLSSIYLQFKKQKQKIYIKQKQKNIHIGILSQVAIDKVILLPLKKTDYRSHLINFLCSSPVHHSHLAKTVYL